MSRLWVGSVLDGCCSTDRLGLDLGAFPPSYEEEQGPFSAYLGNPWAWDGWDSLLPLALAAPPWRG